MGKEEQLFLDSYDAGKYERPSVTADIVVFTLDPLDWRKLSILLIQRGGHPFKGKWALPGGFLQAGKESVDMAAERELYEETGVRDTALRQLGTFSDPGRDPRTHVVSVAYTACAHPSRLRLKAGDDAQRAELFTVRRDMGSLVFAGDNGKTVLTERDLAFDHALIIRTALERLAGRVDYAPDALDFLYDRQEFTAYELKTVYDAVKDKEHDNGNFRKFFKRNFLDKGIVEPLGKVKPGRGHRAAAAYRVV